MDTNEMIKKAYQDECASTLLYTTMAKWKKIPAWLKCINALRALKSITLKNGRNEPKRLASRWRSTNPTGEPGC